VSILSARSEGKIKMAPKNLKNATALSTGAAAVVLPAATGDGVAHEVGAADALGLGEHVNNDAPGDLAADLVTRPIVAAAPVFEPANTGLDEHPALVGDQAGDAAIAHVAGVDPVATLNTEEGSAADVARTAAPLDAALPGVQSADPSAMELVEEPVDIVVFDLGRTATEEDRINLQFVLDHVQAAFPGFTLPGDARPVFAEPEPVVDYSVGGVDFAYGEKREQLEMDELERILSFGVREVEVTSKVAGFRRAGRAHPAEKVRYPVEAFTREQLLAIMNEPMLVTDLG
jgi:hypothetical protein